MNKTDGPVRLTYRSPDLPFDVELAESLPREIELLQTDEEACAPHPFQAFDASDRLIGETDEPVCDGYELIVHEDGIEIRSSTERQVRSLLGTLWEWTRFLAIMGILVMLLLRGSDLWAWMRGLPGKSERGRDADKPRG